MTEKEIRMRCIEALSGSGIRETNRIIKDADHLKGWVMAAPEEKPTAPRTRKAADKGGNASE